MAKVLQPSPVSLFQEPEQQTRVRDEDMVTILKQTTGEYLPMKINHSTCIRRLMGDVANMPANMHERLLIQSKLCPEGCQLQPE